MRIIFLLFISVIYSAFPVLASPEAESPGIESTDFSSFKQPETVFVRQVINPLTFTIKKDDRIFRLAGLDLPGQTSYDATDNAIKAKEHLSKLIEGEKIRLYQTKTPDKGRLNGMGHHLVHVALVKDGLWIQGELLKQGMARVRTTESSPEMAEQMYEAEQQGRADHKGLWQEARYALLTPETASDAAKAFQIVEGTIVNTAIIKNRIYLNFGQNWKTDFTVSVPPGKRKAFAKNGYNPLEWNGKKVRVRGWLDSYNGPYIEIDHPEAIEFLENE